MTEKRNITKDDIFLKARILSEGVHVKTKNQQERWTPYRPFVMKGCDLVVMLLPNLYSRLEAVIDGEDVTISDMGKVICSGTLEVRRSWRDELLSNGMPVKSIFSGSASIINVVLNFRCYNYDSGQGCKYCGLFAYPRSKAPPADIAHKITKLHVEAAAIAAQNGWRGTIVFTGGALPPSQRSNMTDGLERVITQLSELLDVKILSQLHLAANVYPPEDFSDMHKWKELGINAAEFDLEVMDPAYFKAICPGKSKAHSQEYWKEAQEVAVEVFGRGRGTFQSMVTGIEPMSSLVEGLEERMSKGVYSAPLVLVPTPGSPYAKFRPPTADWFVEANEKITDIYFQYADTLDVNLLEDDRPGFTRVGLSYPLILARDEMMRRLQEQGKYPPGLPSQDFIE
ncbi:MAG: radical SAM protein [Thermodesulfobacteriota bacterium]